MILIDSSVWINLFLKDNEPLKGLLFSLFDEPIIYCHPFVIGEIAIGNIPNHKKVLDDILALPQSVLLDDSEVLAFIESNKLYGKGLGYIDAHLLASARISSLKLWTHDKKLHQQAVKLELAYQHN
jgi:predicted nucleic acid-binding protein